jgi:hypothetical protein
MTLSADLVTLDDFVQPYPDPGGSIVLGVQGKALGRGSTLLVGWSIWDTTCNPKG